MFIKGACKHLESGHPISPSLQRVEMSEQTFAGGPGGGELGIPRSGVVLGDSRRLQYFRLCARVQGQRRENLHLASTSLDSGADSPTPTPIISLLRRAVLLMIVGGDVKCQLLVRG